jgi:hypothetical protein
MLEWIEIQPPLPAMSHLRKAKEVIDTEQDYALTLGTDKRAHCYMGCRISEDVNFETAKFAAWQKEYNDATDCDPETHFEVADYDATIDGALKGAANLQKLKAQKICTDYCVKTYLGEVLLPKKTFIKTISQIY